MNIKGPIVITIEGPPGSGKSQIFEYLLNELADLGVVGFSEGAEVQNVGQIISVVEKQTEQ